MSHLIIKPYDAVFTPQGTEFEETWHNLQTPVEGGIALDGSNIEPVLQPIVQVGFKPDFDAEVSNVTDELAEHLQTNPITDWKVLLADLRANGTGVIPVHVCKDRYTIHSNKTLFDAQIAAAVQVLGPDGFTIATVGTLGAYSQFFVSLAVKGTHEGWTDKAGDVYKNYFNLVSSHNSLVSSQNHLSVVRIVCFNTVQASISDAEGTGTQATFRHTPNSLDLITPETFAANLEAWLQAKEQFKVTLEAMRGQTMNLDQFKAFATGVFTRPDTDELSTQSFNRVNEMTILFRRGRGNVGETLYDGVNAFTEYFTSGNGVGNPKRVRAERRLANANFGQGNEWKLRAMQIASNEEVYAEACKRGEVLYTDKFKVAEKALGLN